jgi:hypothetical protein
MNAIASLVPPSLMGELTMHLRKSGSTMSPAQAATAAIRAWIKAQEQPAPAAPAITRGYQWKNLFLPEGTELRMSTAHSCFHARVEGDDIIFNGHKVSPRGMTLAIAGEGRNAWRDVWLKFPGERAFVPASRCRREQQRAAAVSVAPAPSPADSLSAAALTMSEALKTTLALMERASARAMPAEERRSMLPRRDIDILADQCAFD